MKWLEFIVLLDLLSSCLGLESLISDLSAQYLTQRGAKFVCLLSCDNLSVTRKFAKLINTKSIAIVKVDIAHSELNYGKIKQCVRHQYSPIAILIDANCDNLKNILTYASQEMLFDSQRLWLILGQRNTIINNETEKNSSSIYHLKNTNEEVIEKIMFPTFDNLNISVDADITVAVHKGSQKIFLYEVFSFGKIQGGKLKFIEIGLWNSRKEIHLSFLNKYKYYRRWNFENLKLRMVIVMSPQAKKIDPNFIITRQKVPGVSIITQTASMILHAVSEVHNIRYKYFVVDRWVGSYSRNSTAAVTNMLYFREQDISPAIRLLNFTFGYFDIPYPPLTSIETRYYYKIPTSGPGKFENQFLRPLSTGAWLCALAMSVLCMLILVMTSLIEKRPASAQFAVFSVVASICQQFFEDNKAGMKQCTTGRVTILVTGASCVLIYNYYTSSVVSWLLSGPPPSLNSLEELLQSSLELVYEDVGYTRSWLQMPDYYYNKRNAKIEDELRQKKVFNKKKGALLLLPVEKGIEMVKAGGYAYHTEVHSANTLISRTFTQKELCELGSLTSIEKTPLFACLQKDSPYREFYTWSLLRLLERGIISCIQHRTGAPDVSCEGSSPRALALGGAAPTFILLGAGYILGVGIMILERLLHKTNFFKQR